MSVGHLVHVLLTVYNATVHVTQKSPGPFRACSSCLLQHSANKEVVFILWCLGPAWGT